MMKTTFDLLLAHTDALRGGEAGNWKHDNDAASNETRYCESWGVQRSDVRMFVALRASKLLRDAFVEKFDVVPELEYFEDFVVQLGNVIILHDDTDLDPLTERVDAVVREYLPAGVVASDPAADWDGEGTTFFLSHPSAPGTRCALYLGDDAGEDQILGILLHTLEDWWYDVVGEPDIFETGAFTAQQREAGLRRYLFAGDLATAYLKISERAGSPLAR